MLIKLNQSIFFLLKISVVFIMTKTNISSKNLNNIDLSTLGFYKINNVKLPITLKSNILISKIHFVLFIRCNVWRIENRSKD